MSEKADEGVKMPAEVDFSESIPNPYADELRRRVTITADGETIKPAQEGTPDSTLP